MKKLIRVTTVPISLLVLLKGQLSFFKKYFEMIGVSSPGPELHKLGEQERIRTVAIKMTRSITPFSDLLSLLKMFLFFRKEKPYIVHSHTPKAGTISMIASKLAGVKYRIHTVAGLPLLEQSGFKRTLLNLVETFTYACASEILVNSNGLKDIIINHKFAPSSKLKVLGYGSSNGIDTTHFDPASIKIENITKIKESYGINESDLIFIFVGRLVRDKGIEELIEAFHKLSSIYKNTKLLLLGKREANLDPLSKNTNSLIEKNNNILELGFMEDVRPFLAVSDVLVHPSYREGFPNVVLQAGAMKKPCIVTDINGCNEIINHGYNGLIVEAKNSDQLFMAMQQLLTEETIRLSMSINSRPLIKEKFEQQFVWDELLKYYQSLE